MEMEGRLSNKKPKEIKYHQEQGHVPGCCECYRNQELGCTNPLCHQTTFSDSPMISNSVPYQQNRDLSGPWLERESTRNTKVHVPGLCECYRNQDLGYTNPLRHQMPFSDRSTICNSVLYEQNKYLSGPWLEQESARNTKVHVPGLCECYRNQDLRYTNPLHHQMPFSDRSTICNSVLYERNKYLSGPWLEQESARNTEVHVPGLCECYGNQELGCTNPLCHRTPFSDGPTVSQSVSYQRNKDLEHKSARNVKRHILEMKAALAKKYIENLQMQEEITASELLAVLHREDLKKPHDEARMHAVDTYHLGPQANREDKRSYVHIWQTSRHIRPEMSDESLEIKRPKADRKNIKKEVRVKAEEEEIEVPEPHKTKLQKKWLEESVEKLRSAGSQASLQNLQEWFQASIANFKEKGPQGSKQNLRQWLETTKENLQEKCPQASRRDVKEWLEISLRNIQEEDPNATTVNVEEWLETSMKRIQDFQEQGLEVYRQAVPNELEQERPETSKRKVQEWLTPSKRSIQDLQDRSFEESTWHVKKKPEQKRPEVPELLRDPLRKGWLHASLENLRRGGSEKSKQNIQEGLQALMNRLSMKVPEAPKQDLQEWLEARIQNLQEECPEESRKDMKEWLEISKNYLQKEGPETSKLSVQEWLKVSMKSVQDRQERHFEGSTESVQDLPKDPEQTRPKVPELRRDHLKKSWIEVPIENLKRSEASRKNVQEGLKAVMSRLSKKCPETSKQNLQEWLEARIQNLQEECPEESRKDMKEWFEISKNYLQEEGPEIPKLSVHEWLKASMRSIQDLQETGFEGSTQNVPREYPEVSRKGMKQWFEVSTSYPQKKDSKLNVEEWLPASMSGIREPRSPEVSEQNLQVREFEASITDVRPSFENINLLDQRLERSSGNVHAWYRSNQQDVGKQLQLFSDIDSCEVSPGSIRDWLSECGRNDEVEHLEIPGKPRAERRVRSTRDLPAEGPGSSTLSVKGGLQAFIPKVRRGASRLKVQEWLESSMRNLEEAGVQTSKLSLQRWLEESMRTLDEKCPENSRHDVQDWVQASLRQLQEPKISQLTAQEWIGASLMSLKGKDSDVVEYLQGFIKDLQEEASRLTVQEWLETSLIKLQEEDPESSRNNVKEWLESSLREFPEASPETSGQYIKKWLERSLGNLHTPKQNLQGYMKESLEHLREGRFAASASRHNMDWCTVPRSITGVRDSKGILKHGSSRVHFDRHDVSSLTSEGNIADLEQEEASEISQIFITPEVHPQTPKQRGVKGKHLHDQGGSKTKMLIAKVSSAFFKYRKPLMMLAIMMTPPALIVLAFLYYRWCCSSCGGLRPT